MYQVDEKPETIHLYVVREEVARPSIAPIILSVLSLSLLIALGVLLPYQQPETRIAIRVPAVLLPLKTFTAFAPIIPTGIKTYPATQAHGMLTLTNGSVVSATLPKGFVADSVVTDAAVFVPAGSANGFGIAIVPAHALISGKGGDFATFAIDTVVNSSIYIRNLQPFTGGKDAFTVSYATQQDRLTALDNARMRLKAQIIAGILLKPCDEVVNFQVLVVKLVVRCQFLTYHIPSYMKVTEVRVFGKNLLVTVIFVANPRRIWVK